MSPPSHLSVQDNAAFGKALDASVQLSSGVKIKAFNYYNPDTSFDSGHQPRPWSVDKKGNVIVPVLITERNGSVRVGFISEQDYNSLGFPPLNNKDASGKLNYHVDPDDDKVVHPETQTSDASQPGSTPAYAMAGGQGPGGTGPGASGPPSGPQVTPPPAGNGGGGFSLTAPANAADGKGAPASGSGWGELAGDALLAGAAWVALRKFGGQWGGKLVKGNAVGATIFAGGAAAFALARGGDAKAATQSAIDSTVVGSTTSSLAKGDVGGAATNLGTTCVLSRVSSFAWNGVKAGGRVAWSGAEAVAPELTAAAAETAVAAGVAIAETTAVVVAAVATAPAWAIVAGVAAVAGAGYLAYRWWNSPSNNNHAPAAQVASNDHGPNIPGGRPGMHGPARHFALG